MSERTLIFHRATLPDTVVLLPPEHPVSGGGAVLTADVVSRNSAGSIIGKHQRSFDPWLVTAFTVGLGEPSGQTNYRHTELTLTRQPGDLPETETLELAMRSQLTLTGVSVNEDGHRTQPYTYAIPAEGLQAIDIGSYDLKPPPGATRLGTLIGRQRSDDGTGWVPVYNEIQIDGAA